MTTSPHRSMSAVASVSASRAHTLTSKSQSTDAERAAARRASSRSNSAACVRESYVAFATSSLSQARRVVAKSSSSTACDARAPSLRTVSSSALLAIVFERSICTAASPASAARASRKANAPSHACLTDSTRVASSTSSERNSPISPQNSITRDHCAFSHAHAHACFKNSTSLSTFPLARCASTSARNARNRPTTSPFAAYVSFNP